MGTTADYLSFVQSVPQLSFLSVLTLFFLGLMRVVPVVALAPFLGNRVPGPVKMGLSMIIVVILLPFLVVHAHLPAPTFDMLFLIYSLKEILVGVLMGLLVSVPFWIAQSAGTLIDFQRGSSSLMVQDPTTTTQVSPIGLLYNYVLIVMFYELGGPFLVFEGFLDSYAALPADALLPSSFFQFHTPISDTIITLLQKMLVCSIQLSAPSLVAILMTEVFLGIANRLAQQIQIAFLGMSLKSLVGITLLYIAWLFILKEMGTQTMGWMSYLSTLFH